MTPEIIYTAAGFAGMVMILGTILLLKLPPAPNLESRKVRLAAAMFTGIMVLIVFASLLSIGSVEGKDIFNKLLYTLAPLAGTMLGYFFGAGGIRRTGQQEGVAD